MKYTNDPDWIDAYVEHGELPVSRLDQAVLCDELSMALGMQWCKGTDHLSGLVAMVDRRVPSEIRGDAEKVAHHVITFGKRNPCQSTVVGMLMKKKQTSAGAASAEKDCKSC